MSDNLLSQNEKFIAWNWKDSHFIVPFDPKDSEEIEEDYQEWLLNNDKPSCVFTFFGDESSFCIDYKKMKTFCILDNCKRCSSNNSNVNTHMNHELIRMEL